MGYGNMLEGLALHQEPQSQGSGGVVRGEIPESRLKQNRDKPGDTGMKGLGGLESAPRGSCHFMELRWEGELHGADCTEGET